MGQWYDIGLQAGKKVATKVDEFIKSEGFAPEGRKELRDGSVVYQWYMKWNPYLFKDEGEFTRVLHSFDNQDGMTEDDFEATAYKLVAVGDEGDVDEYANEGGYEFFCDLYSSLRVEYPDEFSVPDNSMSKERLAYLAGRAIGELIYGEWGVDSKEMREWVKNEFDITEKELGELGI